jgi:hypothetical protein
MRTKQTNIIFRYAHSTHVEVETCMCGEPVVVITFITSQI